MAKHDIKTKKIWKDLSYDAKVFFDEIHEFQNGDVVYPLSDMEIIFVLHFVEVLAQRRKEAFPAETWTRAFRVANNLALTVFRQVTDPVK